MEEIKLWFRYSFLQWFKERYDSLFHWKKALPNDSWYELPPGEKMLYLVFGLYCNSSRHSDEDATYTNDAKGEWDSWGHLDYRFIRQDLCPDCLKALSSLG